MIPDLDVYTVLPNNHLESGTYFYGPTRALACPVCGGLYQHTEEPYTIDSQDRAGTVWEGRGTVLIIPVAGECGVTWQLCLGFHKGYTGVFVRVITSCKDASRHEG